MPARFHSAEHRAEHATGGAIDVQPSSASAAYSKLMPEPADPSATSSNLPETGPSLEMILPFESRTLSIGATSAAPLASDVTVAVALSLACPNWSSSSTAYVWVPAIASQSIQLNVPAGSCATVCESRCTT